LLNIKIYCERQTVNLAKQSCYVLKNTLLWIFKLSQKCQFLKSVSESESAGNPISSTIFRRVYHSSIKCWYL